MKEIVENKDLVAFCGLYCGACGRYLKDKCPGCHENEKAKWCKVRSCCLENNYLSCADCTTYNHPKECKKFHNFFSRIMAVVFNSDRASCTMRIKDVGRETFAQEMTQKKKYSILR